MPPIQNNNSTNPKQQITMNTNYFGTDGVIINENPTKAPKRFNFNVRIMIVVLALLVVGSVSYAYFNGIGFFSRPPYKENNLISGIISKFPEIKSASYKVSVNFYTKDRDFDALPFVVSSESNIENNLKYSRDYKRSEDIKVILDRLKYYEYSALNYPRNLSDIKNSEGVSNKKGNLSLIDPLSKTEYKYETTNNGKDFVLEIQFETNSVINQILDSNKNSNDNSKIVITDNKAKFTKNTYSYFYITNRPPKSFFEIMNDFTYKIPVEVNIDGAVSGASNWGNTDGPIDWKFNLGGQGDFGDLTYKVNVDINRKDKNYFVKINNLPTLFFFAQIPKGEWIKLNSDKDENTDLYGFLPDVNQIEKEIDSSKESFAKLLKSFANIADQENLFTFRDKPKIEKINGKMLYRYDLQINKNSILPFYKKITEELYKDEYSSIDDLALISETRDFLEYLESEEFDQVFEYFDRNSKNILWVDSKGYPLIYEFTFRIVPPEENKALKDKQIIFTYKIELNDINKPIDVEMPKSFKTLQEVMDSMYSGSNDLADKAIIKSKMMGLSSEASLFHDQYLAYGTKPFPLGECKNVAGTLFEDPEILSIFDEIKAKNSTLKCVSTAVTGKVTSYAISATIPDRSGYSFCIDSSGYMNEIFGELQGISCSDLE